MFPTNLAGAIAGGLVGAATHGVGSLISGEFNWSWLAVGAVIRGGSTLIGNCVMTMLA